MVPPRFRFLVFSLQITFAILVMALPVAARAREPCPAFDPPTLTLTIENSPVREDHGRSLNQLAAMRAGAAGPTGTAGWHTLGLSSALYGERMKVRVMTQGMDDRTVCAALETLTVSFGYRERVVYIAREIPRDSCTFDEVRNHEFRHVAVDDRWLSDFEPMLRDRLDAALARLRTVRQGSRGQAITAFSQAIDTALRRAMQEFERERDRRQSEVDTIAEYQRIGRACDGEARRFVH